MNFKHRDDPHPPRLDATDAPTIAATVDLWDDMTQRDIECTELEFASLIEMSGRLQQDRLLHRCIGRLAEVYPQVNGLYGFISYIIIW